MAFISTFSRIANIQIPDLTPGISVIMEVKVVSDINRNAGRNFGIYREEESNFVIAKTYRLEEVGVEDSKKINYKSKVKITLLSIQDLSLIHI